MDDRNPIYTHLERVLAAFEIVKEATLAKVTLPQSRPDAGALNRILRSTEAKGKLVFSIVATAVTITLVFAGLAYFFKNALLADISRIASAISILSWLAYMGTIILSGIPAIVDVVRAPFDPLLASVRHAITHDQQYIDRLCAIDVKALKQVLAHYKTERILFERRGALLSGSIDRIGLFPALGAVALLYLGLRQFTGDNSWAQILVPIIVFFHFMNFLAFSMYQKIDRIISMLEISIELSE